MSEGKRDDGGPAFPFDNGYGAALSGMSLRDWFAGQALTGLLAYPNLIEGDQTKYPNVTAKLAYQFADAMLKARP